MKRVFIALLAASALLQGVKAQNLSASEVQKMVNTKGFIFEAQTLTPGWGGLKQLSSDYYLKMSGDTLVSFLPYFGRTYTAPINSSSIGFDFTTTNFDYNAAGIKKGGYLVTIKSKDQFTNVNFLLTAFENGRASLQVSSNDRQPVSYNGYIQQ